MAEGASDGRAAPPGDYGSLLEELRALKTRASEIEQQLVALTAPGGGSSLMGWGGASLVQARQASLGRDATQRSGPGSGGGPSSGGGSEVPLTSSNGGGRMVRSRSANDLPPGLHLYQPGQDVPMESTRVVMHQIVPPSECDVMGICFGGQVLSWIDVCAGLSAKLLAKRPCVTVSVDTVHFLRPCRVGAVVIIAAMVNRTFKSSMEIGVRVESEDMRTGERHHCCSAYLTFVALKDQEARNGAQAPVLPRVVPTSGELARIYEDAEGRRSQRLAERQTLRGDPARARLLRDSRLRPVTHREGCPTLPPSLRLLPGQGGLPGAGGAKRVVRCMTTTAHMTQSVMPQFANTLGITFGGQVMRWMEQCAYISASRLRCGTGMLTAAMDSITFVNPTRVGDILYITSQVTAIFDTSLEVNISVFGETPAKGKVFHCADAYATVVVMDEQGNPTTIPFTLEPHTPAAEVRCEGAEQRRQHRLALRQALLQHERQRPSLDGRYRHVASIIDAGFYGAALAGASSEDDDDDDHRRRPRPPLPGRAGGGAERHDGAAPFGRRAVSMHDQMMNAGNWYAG